MSNLFWSTSTAIFVSSSFVFIFNESLARVSATSWSRFRSRLELSLPKTIRPGVAHAFHERHLLFSPLIQCRRFDLGYVHAQPAMRPRTLQAHERAVRHGRPLRILRVAIGADRIRARALQVSQRRARLGTRHDSASIRRLSARASDQGDAESFPRVVRVARSSPARPTSARGRLSRRGLRRAWASVETIRRVMTHR